MAELKLADKQIVTDRRPDQRLPLITISDVKLRDIDRETLVDFHLDEPAPGSESGLFTINFDGWAIGRHDPVVALELTGTGIGAVRLPVGFSRGDLADRYPGTPWASGGGFRVGLSALGLRPEFELLVSAVMGDERRIPTATVRGRRAALAVADSDEPAVQPLLVTSLGRSGSSLTIELLAAHPQILTYPLWQGEVKAASYWAEVFATLGAPASYLQPVTSSFRGAPWWLGGNRLFDDRPSEPEIERWLGGSQVEDIGRFCKQRLDGFYAQVAALNGEQPFGYFAEKCAPRLPTYGRILGEIYPGTREIFLVRDFRDMLCSVFAFNERLGYHFFGRDQVATDEEYVREFLGRFARLLLDAWNDRSGSAYLLRYEDLLLKPRQTLRSVLAYLDLDRGPDVLELLLDQPEDHARSFRHGTSVSTRESIGRWRKDLEPSLRPVCQETFEEVLATFGYSD
jgi:hypothetical protein